MMQSSDSQLRGGSVSDRPGVRSNITPGGSETRPAF